MFDFSLYFFVLLYCMSALDPSKVTCAQTCWKSQLHYKLEFIVGSFHFFSFVEKEVNNFRLHNQTPLLTDLQWRHLSEFTQTSARNLRAAQMLFLASVSTHRYAGDVSRSPETVNCVIYAMLVAVSTFKESFSQTKNYSDKCEKYWRGLNN